MSEKPQPGDRIEVITKEKSFTGTFVPLEGDAVFVKLKNGYNIGVSKKNVVSVKVIEKYAAKQSQKAAVQQDQKLPHISILHTGGTIASKVDYATGGVIARFTPEELLDMFPELHSIANISSRLISNMWSDDMRFAHYNIMAKEVEKEIKNGAKGIIITHGTDTLHYTAAALAFALENVPIPVLLVGAQRSSDRGSSDAAVNLVSAASFMAQTDFCGVGICMHDSMGDDTCSILPATRARKMHTSRRDAFVPVNTTPWATVDFASQKITFTRDYPKASKEKLALKLFKEDLKVGVLKVHTNMYACEFAAYKGFDGLLIEGTGLGHAPISVIDDHTKEHDAIAQALTDLSKKTVVAMAPQTIFGRLAMNVYAPGREVQEKCGVIGNYCDMSPETAFIKLAWLLSNYSQKETKQLFAQDLRGEVSEFSDPNGFSKG